MAMGQIMSRPVSVIAELEEAVRVSSSEQRINTLRQTTDLFLRDGERLSDDQVKVFDDVLCHLVAQVETRIKAELGEKLARLDSAPAGGPSGPAQFTGDCRPMLSQRRLRRYRLSR